jgi:hypothetical protein
MATKRKIEKTGKPCGKGYKRVEINPENEKQSPKSDEPIKTPSASDKGNKKKKFKCVRILAKPQKNSDVEANVKDRDNEKTREKKKDSDTTKVIANKK